MSRRTHWVTLSAEGSMHFRLSSSGECIDCWTEVRGTQGASLEDTDAQVACELGTEWLKFGASLGCGSAEEWNDHQRCDTCCPRRDGPGRIFETGDDLVILLCSNACINSNKVLFMAWNGIRAPQKTCLALSSLKNSLLCLKKGEKLNVEKSPLGKVCFNSIFSRRIFAFTWTAFESLHLVCVFAHTITDLINFHFMLMYLTETTWWVYLGRKKPTHLVCFPHVVYFPRM